MNEPEEEDWSAIALASMVRESLARSREPAHFYGLVRGLDIALSTLRDSRADLRSAVRQLRERASRLAENDAYGAGVAFGLELASELTIRCHIATLMHHAMSSGLPTKLTVREMSVTCDSASPPGDLSNGSPVGFLSRMRVERSAIFCLMGRLMRRSGADLIGGAFALARCRFQATFLASRINSRSHFAFASLPPSCPARSPSFVAASASGVTTPASPKCK